MPEKRGHFVPPVVLAMLIADQAHRNPAGKCCIHGTFDTISARTFPCRYELITVYLSLTGGHGTVPATLKLQDVDETHKPIFAEDHVIRFSDPTA